MSTQQITIRLPAERVAALKAAAQAEHRSLAQQVEHQLAAGDMAQTAAQAKREDERPIIAPTPKRDRPPREGER